MNFFVYFSIPMDDIEFYYYFDSNHFDSNHFDSNHFDSNHFDSNHFDSNHFDSNHFDSNHFDSDHVDIKIEPILQIDIIKHLDAFNEFTVIQAHEQALKEREVIIQFDLVLKELREHKH